MFRLYDDQRAIQTRPPKRHTGIKLLVVGGLLAAAGFGGVQYAPTAIDTYRAAAFKPDARVTAVTDQLKLTDRGKQVFYATAPAIQAKAQFNQHCQSTERTAAILGCYVRDSIYLYDVQNPELKGAIEVTAAHELLHAVYHRSSGSERASIDAMIKTEYARLQNDPGIKELMAYYQKAEPGAELDELHSIIGTTIASLHPNLEKYYAKYFTDRPAIIQMNASYNAVFDAVKKQADELQAKITREGEAIRVDRARYDSDRTQLETDLESFKARAEAGQFSSQASFAVARRAMEARISEINARGESINNRINAYNADVEAINKLSVRVNQLNESINGTTAPATGGI